MAKDKDGKGKKFQNLPDGMSKFADGLSKVKVTGPKGENLRRASPEQVAVALNAAAPEDRRNELFSADDVRAVVFSGCPTNADGTIDIIVFTAFLCQETERLSTSRRRQRESSELFGGDRSRKTGGGNSDRQTGSANALGNVGSGTGKRSGFVPQKKGGQQGTMAGRKLP